MKNQELDLAPPRPGWLPGAAVVSGGDVRPARLEHARKVGFESVDRSLDATVLNSPMKIARVAGRTEWLDRLHHQ